MKKTISRHIIFKQLNTKCKKKKKNLESIQRKTLRKEFANFSAEITEGRREYTSIFKGLREKKPRALGHVGLCRP